MCLFFKQTDPFAFGEKMSKGLRPDHGWCPPTPRALANIPKPLPNEIAQEFSNSFLGSALQNPQKTSSFGKVFQQVGGKAILEEKRANVSGVTFCFAKAETTA
ncbi:hypothetical protein RRG08_044567 [Elysia crispata]|uniref:Uncharacterized protein n=1 Tax=Elysia crispata TaxID=231223 RepID=A0AAE1ACE2_9GAST|nr:hypothetical protein RRG08_044567 [Elysia crispata]